ncbi:MAG: hypothetical protein ABIG11_07325, partial [bacterium]
MAFLLLTENRMNNSSCSACGSLLSAIIQSDTISQEIGFNPATVLLPSDSGPQLAYRTRHNAVLSNHHRAKDALKDYVDFFTAENAEKAYIVVKKRNVAAVMFCPSCRFLPSGKKAIFADKMAEGKIPAWLKPVTGYPGEKEGLLFFKIRPVVSSSSLEEQL